MKSKSRQTRIDEIEPVFGAFRPLSALWHPQGPIALYREREPSVRWAIRTMRAELVEARAITIVAGRILVDVDKFTQVVGEQGHKLVSDRSARSLARTASTL